MKKGNKGENYFSPIIFQALRTLRIFSVHRSLPKVAQELGISVNTVTNHMVRLEKEFNKILYTYKNGDVFLTSAGEDLVKTSATFLDTLGSLKNESSSKQGKESSQTFCIATSYGVGNF